MDVGTTITSQQRDRMRTDILSLDGVSCPDRFLNCVHNKMHTASHRDASDRHVACAAKTDTTTLGKGG